VLIQGSLSQNIPESVRSGLSGQGASLRDIFMLRFHRAINVLYAGPILESDRLRRRILISLCNYVLLRRLTNRSWHRRTQDPQKMWALRTPSQDILLKDDIGRRPDSSGAEMFGGGARGDAASITASSAVLPYGELSASRMMQATCRAHRRQMLSDR
jgi:hypothetical protein